MLHDSCLQHCIEIIFWLRYWIIIPEAEVLYYTCVYQFWSADLMILFLLEPNVRRLKFQKYWESFRYTHPAAYLPLKLFPCTSHSPFLGHIQYFFLIFIRWRNLNRLISVIKHLAQWSSVAIHNNTAVKAKLPYSCCTRNEKSVRNTNLLWL